VAGSADIYLIERVLVALKKELASLAHSALDQPAERDAYEYGRMCGKYAGLKQAAEIVEATINNESEDDDHGFYRRGESRNVIRN